MVDLSTGKTVMRAKKRKLRRYIDREEFYLARRRAGLTVEAAATMLDVTARTVRNWENGKSRIPYAGFRLMRLFSGHSLIGKQWEGWSIWRGTLWTPEGRGFEAHELRYISHYLWMAREWLADRPAAPAPIKTTCNSTIPAAPASDGSPASRVPRPSSGAGPEHVSLVAVSPFGLQEKSTEFDEAQNTPKFRVLTAEKNQPKTHVNG